jgi:hypothetical protein
LNSTKSIFFALSFLLIASCRHRINWKYLSQQDLEILRKEFKLPKEKTFRLDTNYVRYLFSFDTLKYADQIKNHFQPIQAAYYNKLGQLISFHINCYADRTKEGEDLYWNQGNAFASFVPRSVAPADSFISLQKHLSLLKTFDHTVIIHWGKRWWPKDCKNLIKLISDNATLSKNKKVNIIYVNIDDLW